MTDPKTNDSYYLAKIDVARKELEKNAPEVELLPGLPAGVPVRHEGAYRDGLHPAAALDAD